MIGSHVSEHAITEANEFTIEFFATHNSISDNQLIEIELDIVNTQL